MRVFPQVNDRQLREQEQERFASLPGKLNTAVLDTHYVDWTRSKTGDELGGFTRCNGNIIAPPPIPVKPWEPRHFMTKEEWQKDLSVFDAMSRRKDNEAAVMQQSKNYADNFTVQREKKECRAMVSLPRERDIIMMTLQQQQNSAAPPPPPDASMFSPPLYPTPQPQPYPQPQPQQQYALSHSQQQQQQFVAGSSPILHHQHSVIASLASNGISGFKGLGRVSIDLPHGRAKVETAAGRTSVPPWLQAEACGPTPQRSPSRVNPSLTSNGVCDVFGVPPCSSSFGYHGQNNTPTPARSESSLNGKGISYAKETNHHKKIFRIPDSTGGQPSPAGARLLRREETTNGEAFHAARLEALAAGRAQTSMLP